MVSTEGREVLQLTPIEEYNPEEGKVTMCDSLVDAAQVIPVMLANQTSKTIKKRRKRGRCKKDSEQTQEKKN